MANTSQRELELNGGYIYSTDAQSKDVLSLDDSERTTSSPNRLRRGAGAALAVGIAAVLAACSSPTQAEPVPSETTSTSAPSPEATETSSPEIVTLVDFPELKAGLTTEELGVAFNEVLNLAENAGSGEAIRDRRREANVNWETMIAQVVDENQEVFTSQYFIDGWEEVPALANFASAMTQANTTALDWYTTTAWSGDEKPENVEGFRSWSEVTSTTETVDGDPNDAERTIVIETTSHTNSDKNLGPAPGSVGGIYTVKFTEVNGLEKVSGINVQAIN